MEQEDISECLTKKPPDSVNSSSNPLKEKAVTDEEAELIREPLTTKNAIKLLLEGTLKRKVCRYCLNITTLLYEMDQIFHIAGRGILYKVTVRDMMASFHPFKVNEDPNFPNRICDVCLNSTISSYLFTQQCEQAGRALWNCFDDMYEKLNKLDPLERVKKRGRQKLNPNYNVLYAEHENVINYADPIINMINIGSELIEQNKNVINELECPRCWQVFPNLESLYNHEKIHPKTMWYNCHACGKSFPKHMHLRKHFKKTHVNGKEKEPQKITFRCVDCGIGNETYDQHLQHIEKHKFSMVMQHLIDKKMDRLCTICLCKDNKMVELDKNIDVYGGYPELSGKRSLYSILGSTMPEMNILNTYTGTKICERCLDHAITSYIFLNQAQYIRNRLNSCINLMLENLDKINKPEGKIFIEISQNMILPDKEPDYIDENLLIDEDEEIEEDKLPIEVLEDEFRIESDGESSVSEEKDEKSIVNDRISANNKILSSPMNDDIENNDISNIPVENPAKTVTKTYTKRNLFNGIHSTYNSHRKEYVMNNICSEFLTFKKKRATKKRIYTKFTCPLCSKHFISDYFLKKHVLKHVIKKVECKICLGIFKSKFYLHEHMKTVHLLGKNNYFSCKICGRMFVNKNKMKSHTKTHLKKECQLCNKAFATQRHYDSHMERHTVKFKCLNNKQLQTCSFCEKAYLNDNALSVHVNKVHLQIKPYSCDMCDKQFYTETNLGCHKKVHNMFSREKCEFCAKILKSRKDLVVHIRKHIGVKPFRCQICTQSFYSQSKLKNHMKILHGGRFCCKICRHVFANKSGLQEHVNRVHNII